MYVGPFWAAINYEKYSLSTQQLLGAAKAAVASSPFVQRVQCLPQLEDGDRSIRRLGLGLRLPE